MPALAPTDVDASPISWRETGEGQVVVFLHGLGGSRLAWEPQLRSLGDRWRCVAWDMPGYGSSDPIEPLTFPAIADALVGLIDRLGANRVDLVGLSFGGMHALHAALRHPDRIRRLVLADTSAAFGADGTSRDDWIASRLSALDGGRTPADFGRSVISAISAPGFSGPDFEAAAVAFERIGVEAFRAAVRCLPDHDVGDQLAHIVAPTLVIVGEHDTETPPAYARALAEGIPNARLVELENCGHVSPSEAPMEFNREVRLFLESTTR